MKVFIVLDVDGSEIKGISKVLTDRESARKYVKDVFFPNNTMTTKIIDSLIIESDVESYGNLF